MALFGSPTAYVRRMGVQRGLFGGSNGWLVAGGVLWVLGRMRRAGAKREEVVATEVLKPGQTVCIEAIRPRDVRR